MPKYNKLPVIISIIALFLALGDMPYGYYQLLKFLVCGVGIYAAYTAFTFNKIRWVWTMGIIALIFNPFIKFYFNRDLWQFINVLVAIVFMISLFIIRQPKN